MRFTQLIETFVITNDQFEDYLNRSTEQLKSELDMGKNLRDAIHDLARSFADMHNKSYEAYERMSDSLLARSHILELGNDSATIDQVSTDIEPEMDMGEPAMDLEDEVEESLEAIEEGPCDVATKDELSKMSGKEYDKYAQWKKDCEHEERVTPLSTKRLESEETNDDYDDYHGDMSKEEYDKTVNNSEMEYTVWVGGTEVNDYWLNYDEAVALYDKYKEQGYDDIQLDARIKDGHVSEETTEEGNEFSGELAKAKIDGRKEFKVGGKKYEVEESKTGDMMRDDEKKRGNKRYGKFDKDGHWHSTSSPDPEDWERLKAKGYELVEDEEGARGYIVFHSKKGKFETHADTSYEAAEKAAKHWKLKSTAGVSAHLVQDDKGDQVTQVADADTHEDVLKAPDKDKEQAIDARDDFMKVMDKKPQGPKAIDTIKQIVADTQNMQVKFDDGKMKVDLYTASAVSQVYDAVKPETQAKMDTLLRTKAGMLKISNFAFSSLKEAYAGTDGVTDRNGKIHDPKSPKAKMIINMKRKPGNPTDCVNGKIVGTGKPCGTGDKFGTAKSIAGAVGGGLKKAGKALGGAMAGAATRSGFGNPLSASKYSESMAEGIMQKAIEQTFIEK